jgi:hydrogenase nickel incorporation protein HypB
MCKECGCGLPGEEAVGISAQHHEHSHTHAHPHEHKHHHDHGHGVENQAAHVHDHEHEHEHGPGHHHGEDHHAPHSHPHTHQHAHPAQAHDTLSSDSAQDSRRTIELHEAILAKNDRLAERNRGFFHARGLLVLNVLSSPGSGKTTLLRETVGALKGRLNSGVIVGDLATDNDARRLGETGAPVVQITTGTRCHLEAEMVARAVKQLQLEGLELLIIENVGNLVCPAAYDLGEDLRIVLVSVTEGEDKPLKYPPMFQAADVVVISKIDLAQACEFDRSSLLANLGRVAPRARVFELSARTGEGMDAWRDYLVKQHQAAKTRDPLAV